LEKQLSEAGKTWNSSGKNSFSMIWRKKSESAKLRLQAYDELKRALNATKELLADSQRRYQAEYGYMLAAELKISVTMLLSQRRQAVKMSRRKQACSILAWPSGPGTAGHWRTARKKRYGLMFRK
jgi:uncharacterized protein YukE